MELKDVHRSIFKYMRKKALEYEYGHSEELKAYQKDQKAYAQKKFTIVDIRSLQNSIKKSKVVFLGDFHTFDQSSKNLLRILNRVVETSPNLVLGFEFIHTDHQKHVEQYLNRNITELEFLELIKYHDSWKFPWGQYRPLFEFAIKRKLKVVALNSEGSLSQRDERAAQEVAKSVHSGADKVIVFFGELHILPDKLPRMVQKKCIEAVPITVIHQNLDSVYWRISPSQKNTQEGNIVIKFDDDEFAIQSSPPWIKYESMIYWFENLNEDPEFDIHEARREQGLKGLNNDAHDNFVYLCKKILESIRADIPSEQLEDFNLYDYRSLETIVDRVQKLKFKYLAKSYQTMLEHGQFFSLPDKNVYYCSSYSINRLSYLAGIHVLTCLQKNHNGLTRVVESSKRDRLYLLMLQFLMGEFSARIINPYRKCNLYKDILNRSRAAKTNNDTRQALKTTLQLLEDLSQLGDISIELEFTPLYKTAKYLGHLLSHYVYKSIYLDRRKDSVKILTQMLKPSENKEILLSEFTSLLSGYQFKRDQKRLF